jgi:hypothetical protein
MRSRVPALSILGAVLAACGDSTGSGPLSALAGTWRTATMYQIEAAKTTNQFAVPLADTIELVIEANGTITEREGANTFVFDGVVHGDTLELRDPATGNLFVALAFNRQGDQLLVVTLTPVLLELHNDGDGIPDWDIDVDGDGDLDAFDADGNGTDDSFDIDGDGVADGGFVQLFILDRS